MERLKKRHGVNCVAWRVQNSNRKPAIVIESKKPTSDSIPFGEFLLYGVYQYPTDFGLPNDAISYFE